MKRRRIVIACKVLKPQLDLQGNPDIDYVYLKQGLHMTPDLLKEELQRSIDEARGYDDILLGYGLCSRAVIGLKAQHNQRLVIPKIDDCIGISMGSRQRYYLEFNENPGTYYFTKGWAEADSDPLKEYYISLEKYDEETALWAACESLKHYMKAVLISTENEELEEVRKYVQKFARFFDLKYEEIDGSLNYLRKLLHGPYNEEFVVVEKGEALEDSMFR